MARGERWRWAKARAGVAAEQGKAEGAEAAALCRWRSTCILTLLMLAGM